MWDRTLVFSKEANYILLCLCGVFLSCALKNYLIFFLNGTIYCEYLCPSALGRDVFSQPELINHLYKMHHAVVDAAEYYLISFFNDSFNLFSVVFAIPLIEESIYRGPLYLSKRYSDNPLWWVTGILLVILFTFSHDRGGLALLPVFVLGLSSWWLILVTRKFWPSLTIHVLYNFFFYSISFYQVALLGE